MNEPVADLHHFSCNCSVLTVSTGKKHTNRRINFSKPADGVIDCRSGHDHVYNHQLDIYDLLFGKKPVPITAFLERLLGFFSCETGEFSDKVAIFTETSVFFKKER